MNSGSVLCVGSIGVDYVIWPAPKHSHIIELCYVNNILQCVGGCAANVSVILAKLGKKPRLVGRIGLDAAGHFVSGQLEKDGVDISDIVIDDKGNTGATAVLVSSDGSRSFMYAPGVNRNLNRLDVVIDDITEFDIIHLSDVFLLPRFTGSVVTDLFKEASSRGVITSLDTSWDPEGRWLDLLGSYLPYLDFFFTSLEEASQLAPGLKPHDMVSRFLTLGARTIILKMGSSGCIIANSGGERFTLKPRKVNPVDTTGAGDTFVGAFLSAFLEGVDLITSATIATRLAEECILSLGATLGLRRYTSAKEILGVN